jgi:sugar-specific transcriptional regulator TrmB
MEENLVSRLLDFGLTVNQAKIYLTIAQSGLTSVGRVAEATHLHRQDIYKILPKLEQMGLIAKTVETPLMIEAIPVETALHSLITTERKKMKEKIVCMEANVKKLISAIRKQQERSKETAENTRFVLLTTDAEIKNMMDYSFGKASIGCDMVLSLDMLKHWMHLFRRRFQTIAKNSARTRLIVETHSSQDSVKETIEEVKPKMGIFAAKLFCKKNSIPYWIIDHKEAWINRKKMTPAGFPCVLWTNCENIVQFREEKFAEAWNDPRAIVIHPERDVTTCESAR